MELQLSTVFTWIFWQMLPDLCSQEDSSSNEDAESKPTVWKQTHCSGAEQDWF